MRTVKSKYDLLNNREWIYEKYIVEKLSTIEISKIAGAKTPNSARQALIKFSIPLRSIGEGLTARRKEDGFILDVDVLNGCLLGDACLIKYNPLSNKSLPYFKKRNKNYDHIKYVASCLGLNDGIKERNEYLSWDKTKPYTVFELRSKSHDILLPFYHRWYPCNTKVIPYDIDINSTVLLHWFMDDGCSYQRRKDSDTRQITVIFCSESFQKKDQELIVLKINNEFDLNAKLCPYGEGSGYRIGISQANTKRFFNIIGVCPVPSMQYKWK